MGRIWEDGFDHYGTDLGNMLVGSYAEADGGVISLSTAQYATGTHSILVSGTTGLTDFDGLRKVLPAAIDKMGMTARFYLPAIPGNNYSAAICHMLSDTPTRAQLSFFVDSNGAIRIVRGAGTSGSNGANGVNPWDGALVATTDPIIVASAWNHVELQAYIHASAGWVRIAVNGIHRYEGTSLNTQYNSTKICSVGQNRPYLNARGTFYMDDYILYDFTGDSAVDTDFCPQTDGTGKAIGYIGELQVWPLFPNGDTAEADWAKSTGTDGYALIDEPTPDDANYVYSVATGDLSEFDLEDLPEEITYIRGLGIHNRLSKSDSGAAMFKAGMKSVAATSDADERPVTVEPTYWRDPIDVDPNSSARWTRDSLNAAWLRLTRSV
jgi:hypothetical protein